MKILNSKQLRIALLSSISIAILGLSATSMAAAAPTACIDDMTENTHFRINFPKQAITVSPGIQNVAMDASVGGNTLQNWSGVTEGSIPSFDSKHMLVINSDTGAMVIQPADPKCGSAPGPKPGPGPKPSPSVNKYSFQLQLPQTASNSSKLNASITPLSSSGQPITDASGKVMKFSASGKSLAGKEYICGTWSPDQSLYLSSSVCGTTPQWLTKLSAQPAEVAVTVADTSDDPTNAYFKIFSTAQPVKLGGTVNVTAVGSPHTVTFQANKSGEKAVFTFNYLDDKGNLQFAAPFTLDFTQNQSESVALTFPAASSKYTLSNGMDLTSFKNIKATTDSISNSTTQVPLTISNVTLPATMQVKGWPNYMAMGSVTAFNNIPKLNKRSFDDAIFKYAGNDGAGDAGVAPLKVWASQATVRTTNLSVALSARYGHPVVPVLVVYTTNASGGSKVAAQKDLDDLTTLSYHYGYLAMVANYLETHPNPLFKTSYGSIVLNPDYLGEAHKDNLYAGVHPQVKQGLTDALNYLATNNIITKAQAATDISKIPSSFGNDFKSYNQSLNWLINTIAPHVSFGYADNVWAGDSTGHGWIHTADENPSELTSHVNGEIAFLKSSGAYGNATADLNPTYIAFDKYERDTIAPAQGTVAGPYFYDANDWTVYMEYVGGISKAFNNKPVMLFQTPGAHLKAIGDTSTEEMGATAPDYILGNKALMNDNLQNDLAADFVAVLKANKIPATFNDPNAKATFLDYTESKPTALTYDNYQDAQANTVWGKGHIEDMLRDNIFSIMWGGGSTTSISSENEDDGGYLNNLLGDYMKGGAYTLTTGKVDASYSVSFKPTITPVKSSGIQLAQNDAPKQISFTVLQKGQYYTTYQSTVADPFPLSTALTTTLPSTLSGDSANAYANWSTHKITLGVSGQNLPSTLTVGISAGKPGPGPGPGPKPGANAFKFTSAQLFHNGSPTTGSFKYACTPIDLLGEYVPTATCTVTDSGADHIATVKNSGKVAVSKIILTALPQGLPANSYIPGIEQSVDQSL